MSSNSDELAEMYSWPWMGIIANIHRKPDEDKDDVHNKDYWLKEFSYYKPQHAEIFMDEQGQTAQAVLVFGNDWDAFKYAMEFEKYFEAGLRSKKEWKAENTSLGTAIFGWFARGEDYGSEGPVGEFLRKNGELKAIADLVQEAMQETTKTVANLADEIDMRNVVLEELQTQFNPKSMSLSRMIEMKDILHQNFCEETRRLQRQSQEHIQSVLFEQERLNTDLENKRNLLNAWSGELDEREAKISG